MTLYAYFMAKSVFVPTISDSDGLTFKNNFREK